MVLSTHSMKLRKAIPTEAPIIWTILQHAIEQRRLDGSDQWQDGYPNQETIQQDLKNGYAYVFEIDNKIATYAAIIFDKDPAYHDIQGKWLTDGDYVNIHRVATVPELKKQGIASQFFKEIEKLCLEKGVYSIKIDTNFDNIPMLKIMDRLEYTYCGEVVISGAPRKAFEKVLPKPNTKK